MESKPPSTALPEDVALSVRNVSKKFCRDLKRSMRYGLQDLGKNLLGLNREAEKHSGLRKDEFWSLRDISFEVKKGESLGVIGLNGSGKTTLMRLIHGIFPPDAGSIAVRGKIGALIALGAGFHPHMTGRENIFLNGAILGIPIEDIRASLSAIVDFAEIGEFIDAPVSTYSSGMKVRLGFAVAAHMATDTLLIDEVLAVGDLPFRNKCARFMRECLSGGRTILFVSHNMNQVSYLCTRAILLDRGAIVASGETDEVIAEYHKRVMLSEEKSATVLHCGHRPIAYAYRSGEVHYEELVVLNENGQPGDEVVSERSATFRIVFSVTTPVVDPWVVLFFTSPEDGRNIAFAGSHLTGHTLTMGRCIVELHIPAMPLMPSLYRIGSLITKSDRLERLARADDILTLKVLPAANSKMKTSEAGYFYVTGDWACRPG